MQGSDAREPGWPDGADSFIEDLLSMVGEIFVRAPHRGNLDAILSHARETDDEKARLASVSTKLPSALRSARWVPGAVAGWTPAQTAAAYEAIASLDVRGRNRVLAPVVIELIYPERPTTVRHAMYHLVSGGWLPDTGRRSYDPTQRLLARLREKGLLPFEWIADNVRSTIKPSSWTGIHDFNDTVIQAYRKDFWVELPDYVVVICEKDSIAGTLAPVTQEFDVPLHPIRGYNSLTFKHEIARELALAAENDKSIHVYYMGDHDPSGRDLERDCREKIAEYLSRLFHACAEVSWTRLAVQPDQFEQFDILPLKPKAKDARTPGFVARWGSRCAEVEAIPATSLRQMLRQAIESHIPQRRWRQLQRIEAAERRTWQEHLAKLPTLNGGRGLA